MQHPSSSRRTRRIPREDFPPGELRRRLQYAGDLLARSRETRGLIIADIAERIGLSTSGVGNLETPPVPPPDKKQQVPNLDSLMLYTQILGIDFCDLFPADPESPYAQLRLELARFDAAWVTDLTTLFVTLSTRKRTPTAAGVCTASLP